MASGQRIGDKLRPGRGPRYADRLGPQATPVWDAPTRADSFIALLASALPTGARRLRRNDHATRLPRTSPGPGRSRRRRRSSRELTRTFVRERGAAAKPKACAAGRGTATGNVTTHAPEPSQRRSSRGRALRRDAKRSCLQEEKEV
jgi:hypothetical protein